MAQTGFEGCDDIIGDPHGVLDAWGTEVCLQDMLAISLPRGGLRLAETYFPAALDDPGFLRLRGCVTAVVVPVFEVQAPDGRGAEVAIRCRDGRTFTKRVDFPRGHSAQGTASWADPVHEVARRRGGPRCRCLGRRGPSP